MREGCDNYRRPKGILGGPCLNCGEPQPAHRRQLDAFVNESEVRPPPPAAIRALARDLAEQGADRAVAHADQDEPGWSERAYRLLLAFIAEKKTIRCAGLDPTQDIREFSTEDVREWIGARLPEPPDRRAWGAIVRRAVTAGLIVRAGYRPHRDPSRHHGVSTLWRVRK